MNVDAGIGFGDLSGILRRRGKVAGFTILGCVLVSYWIAMSLPNLYTSYATVLVEPQSVDQELIRAGVQSSDLNSRLHLMTAQILSRPRLSGIIDRYSLYEEESEYLLREELIDLMRSRVSVEPVESDLAQRGARVTPEINEFRIYFSDYSSAVARDVAQQLANDFIDNHIESRVEVSQKSLEFIQGELERLAERIRIVEAKVTEVKNANPGSLPEDFVTNQRRIERLLSDLAIARRAHAEATSDQGFYQSQAATAQFMGAPNDDASPTRRLELLKLKLAEHRSRGFTERHPDIIATKAEILAVETSIDEILAKGQPAERPNMLQQQAQAQVDRAGMHRAAAQAEIDRLEALTNQIQGLIVGTPAVAEQLDGLKREYEHLFSSYQDFSRRHQEASVQAQLERRQLGEQFRVLEAAFQASDPSSPNRPLIIALGVFFGLALGGGLAVVIEAADTTAHNPRRLQSSFGLPVLASIPRIWLEADRVALRRKRLRTALATAAVVAFALVGGVANYMFVNGTPGFLQSQDSDGEESERPAAGIEG